MAFCLQWLDGGMLHYCSLYRCPAARHILVLQVQWRLFPCSSRAARAVRAVGASGRAAAADPAVCCESRPGGSA